MPSNYCALVGWLVIRNNSLDGSFRRPRRDSKISIIRTATMKLVSASAVLARVSARGHVICSAECMIPGIYRHRLPDIKNLFLGDQQSHW